ncbi:uncharacterized protein LOC120015423 isoform X2 [Tripterygium wilfordii]|uniref:uncharacterized protein LOC120015423 isoform X2 n=1 Tax=Tripterygium wilfordii TaxID=458696 RepID=UPI0018F82371|nr:uncharacterized protein LOC120015423 isoform X2 [Tripterygium wilfordii]
MEPTVLPYHHHHYSISSLQAVTTSSTSIPPISNETKTQLTISHQVRPTVTMVTQTQRRRRSATIVAAGPASQSPLDLTEDNVTQVLADARVELAQIFDNSVGITVGLAELDGPFVKISLKGKFWHKRSMVLARVANYLKQRIPEILEVEIEDEKQLDDSPENF